MAMRKAIRAGALVLAVLLAGYGTAQAQVAVSSADIQRLQDLVYDASSEISRLRSRDSALAERLQLELDDLREEVVYLKVKMRKERSVSRTEYSDLRDRIESVRSRAAGRTTSSGASSSGDWDVNRPAERTAGTVSVGPNTVPSGTEIDARLQTPLTSDTAQVEDRFEATTDVDLYQGEKVLIPAGSVLRGVVTSVDRASRTDRKGSLTLSFDQITVRGRSYPMRATVTEALESEGIKGEAARIGTGAGVGAIIGGILGGVKGALIGILVGAGGTIAATEGKDVHLEPGTILRVRIDESIPLRQ
jgi:hypothetical protein